MRIVKVYKPCEQCKGTGIETNDRLYGENSYQSWECRICQGNGEVIETVRKESIHAPMETKRGRTEQN